MPRGDRTGPQGAGSMRGRGAGYCGGNNSPGYANAYGGRGRGRGGFGGGGRFGRRNMYYATGVPGWARSAGADYPYGAAPAGAMPPAVQPQDEATALKEQADYLEKALADIKSRLGNLEK